MTTQLLVKSYVDYSRLQTKPAAIIVDCSKITEKDARMLREIASRVDALLIFDEVITGFRWDIGGAQTVWGVTPDLACFSKAMGNGMPISAIVGRSDLMKNFDHVFFSGTFGGETLSIAAAIACIDKIEREDVCDALAIKGKFLKSEFGESKDVWLTGHPSFQQLNFSSPQVKDSYITSMLAQGVLVNTSLNVCFAHNEVDLMQVIDAHHASLEALQLVA